jgi:hypothetical protein
VNAKKVEDKKAHFKQINVELEQTANQLIAKSTNCSQKNDKSADLFCKKTNSSVYLHRNETPA